MESTGTSSCNFNNDGVKLLDAAMEGLADDAVEILIKDSDLIRIADSKGDTAFHVAARAGHVSTVSKMINHVEDLELEEVLCEGNADGDTPLHLAFKNGHYDLCQHLVLMCGTATSIRNDNGETVFMLSEKAGIDEYMTGASLADLEMRLSIDLDKHGDDDAEEKWIKLFKAAEGDEEDVVMEIVEDDPKTLKRKGPSGWTALHMAATSGNMGPLKKMVECIKNNNDLNWLLLEGDCLDFTPLHYAIENGHEKVARYLVEVAPRAIYKVNRQVEPRKFYKPSRKRKSPLCLAIEKGYLDLVRYMTRSDLSRSIREQIVEHAKKASIAHNILKDRNLGALQAIVEGLPDVIYSTDKKGWRPLSYAASKGYFDGFNYIIKNFPDIARKIDDDGSFPIHKAVAGGHVSIVKDFLSCCPLAWNDRDRKGRHLLQIATLYERKAVASYLKACPEAFEN